MRRRGLAGAGSAGHPPGSYSTARRPEPRYAFSSRKGASAIRDYRHLFDVPADVAYFNTANIGPRLEAVSRSGHEAISRFAAPWKIVAPDWFSGAESLRVAAAALLSVEADAIALVPSVSYGIATAAKNVEIRRGSSIVVVAEQYPSNIYAWRRRAAETSSTIRVAERSKSRTLSESILSAIDASTSVVALPHCHWTDGELIDLAAVSEAARSIGAALVIDASQSLGAVALDLDLLRPDFVTAAGYKWLLGPYGLGYLYASERWRGEGTPLEESWLARKGSEDFSRLVEYVDEYRPGARRFDCGEYPQFISVPMARAAISQLEEWGIDSIHTALRERTNRIRDLAAYLGYDTLPVERSAGHMIGLRSPTGLEDDVTERLATKGVWASVRGDTLRIAPHLHNHEADLDRLFEALTPRR